MGAGQVGIVIADEQKEPATTELVDKVQTLMGVDGSGIAPIGHTVTVKFDGNFKNAVLWSQCPLGFVCMEPWNGFPGSLTTPEHETLAPGNALSAVMSVEI